MSQYSNKFTLTEGHADSVESIYNIITDAVFFYDVFPWFSGTAARRREARPGPI